MMRILPDCPACDETNGLCLYRAVNSWTVFCVECGWRVTKPFVDGVTLDDAIAAAVKTYAEHMERWRQIDPGDEMPPLMVMALLNTPIDSEPKP